MRRANKSHKVPNVKLRPAQPSARRAWNYDQNASYERSSDSELPPNSSMIDLCPRPFKSFTICATGTMDKPTLFKMAFELGAVSTSDLTDRVTHLIASAHGGAKYTCALERKIPIMAPEWIAEAHGIWLRGDDVDVEQSVSKHRLPVFSGVILSLSGIEDVARRTEINKLVTAHQGVYVKNLERPVRVTHLLCSGDVETEKMKYAEKFNKRKEAHIHLVWEEWFWDCLEFGGRFDERKYQVNRPRPGRKSLHENTMTATPVQDSAPGTHRDLAIPVDVGDQQKQSKPAVPVGGFAINNFSLDGEEEEMAIVKTRVPAVTLQLWENLLKPRGFEVAGGKLIRSPSKSQTTQPSPSTPTRPRTQLNVLNRSGIDRGKGKEKEKGSVISSFRRANSFAPVPVKESAVRQPFRRNTTCPSVCPGDAEGDDLYDAVRPEEVSVPSLFAGCTFRLLGEARCMNVRSAIENGGGVVTDDDADEATFIIVRLISGSKIYRDECDDSARSKYRTECWLEHCVFHERVCEPNENVTFMPLTIATPVLDAEKVNLSLSGLDQSELCWIRRLVRAVGVALESTFSCRSTHLLCPSGTGAKFDKALEWQIPVVSLAWLEDIARTGTIPLVDDYLVGKSQSGVSRDDEDGCIGQLLVPVRKIDKGKGKATEVDYEMADITNDGSASHALFVRDPALLQDPSQHRQRATQYRHGVTSKAKSPIRGGLFGKPRFLTHDSDPPEDAEAHENLSTSSPAVPPPSSSPPMAEVELPLPGPTPPLQSSSSRVPVNITPTRQIDAASLPLVPTQGRIPSSSSPSPMKLLPSSSIPDAFASSSPARLPNTDAITKALHESLTSLLGKRPMGEDETRDAQGARKGKRVRPGGPSNMVSRDVSREQIVSPTRPPIMRPPPPGELDASLLDGLGGLRSTEEGLSVTYEDPGQVEEKRRLLRMLGGEDVVVGTEEDARGDTAGGRVRRTRRGGVS